MKLDDVAAIMPMNFADEFAPGRNPAIVIDGGVSRDGNSVCANAGIGGNDRRDSAAGETAIPGDSRVRHGAIVVVDASSQTGANDPVLERQPVNRQGLENGVVR
jgi:hypothetical protein